MQLSPNNPSPSSQEAFALTKLSRGLTVLRTDRYDPIEHRASSLYWPVTEGAVAIPNILPLSELRAILEKTKGCYAIISDVHGYDQLLMHVLKELGAVSPLRRRRGDFRLISLGDLADGRCATDFETLKIGEKYFDEILAGNHEAAMMGGKGFNGYLCHRPEVSEILKKLAWSGKLKVATVVKDILLTHAGVTRELFPHEQDPNHIAAHLNDLWCRFLGRPTELDPLLFQVGARRISDPFLSAKAPASGGVLWEDWHHLLHDHPQEFRQIVGHTPVRSPERSASGLVHALDLAGYRVGVAVVLPSKEIIFGSDFEIPKQPNENRA